MAISYDTYYALPRLTSYADALNHYENIKPIRGDKYETRPLGRRDQKWMSIWKKDDEVFLGYGARAEDSRQPLMSFQKSGTVTVHKAHRWHSASDNERISRVLGAPTGTYQYDTWITCAWYDEGGKRKGKLPLRTPQGQWVASTPSEQSMFVRDGVGDLVYLNYTYPVTHKINRDALKHALEPYVPFVNMVKGFLKLQEHGQDYLRFSDELIAEYYGWNERPYYDGRPRPNSPECILRWGGNVRTNCETFLAFARSEDHDDRMRAAIILQHNSREPALNTWSEVFLTHNRGSVFATETHKHGKVVRDRYRRMFL